MQSTESIIENLTNRVKRLERRDEPRDEAVSGDNGGQFVPKSGHGRPDQCAQRQTARAALQSHIEQMHQRTMKLQALCDALPAVLSQEADEALWELVGVAMRR
jgi:hypothetical protein